MKCKTFTSFLAFIVIVFIAASVGGGCANPIAPSGGPKDTLPPVLTDATPQDSTLHFNDKKIVLTFNEYVVLDNVHDNLIVSPLPKHEPIIESKLKTITIRIKDTLEENTTYSYNFGKAIKDNNEGNIMKNYTYVFSTGKYLDSFSLAGHVQNAQTGKADSTLLVMLHLNNDDSALIKQKPRFITKLDGKGDFTFRNLPAGVFYLFALQDEGGQKKYLSKKQLFAFTDKPITIGSNNRRDTLYAFLEKEDDKIAGTRPSVSKADKDKQKEKDKDKRLKFTINLENGQQDILGNLEFTFADPLKKFDSSKVQFTDTAFKPITNYSIVKDTGNKKLTLVYKWPENTEFRLIVDKEFAEDTSGRKIARTDTLKFKTLKESDYGSFNIRFNNLDLSKKPVLQILSGEDIKFWRKITSKDLHVKLFKPGEYDMRILFDSNDNGKWDSGEFFKKHQQPEKVMEVKLKLSVKANWDKEISIDL